MLPTVELFGITIRMGDFFLFMHAPVIPLVLFILRKRYGYTVKKTVFYCFFTFIFGVFAAMITSRLSNFIMETTSKGDFVPYESLNSYGIPLFLAIFYFLFCLLFRKPFREITDYCAPAIFLVQVMGKIVCVCNGCCYGPADPNGLYFQNLGYKAVPVQLYDTIDNAIIFIILMILSYTLTKKHKGYIMPIGCMLYSFQKGCLEELRVYHMDWEGNFFGTGRTYWQFFLAVFFIGSLIWLIGTIINEKKGKPDFDTNENIKIPDLSKAIAKVAEKRREKKEKNKRTYTHSKKNKKKKK